MNTFEQVKNNIKDHEMAFMQRTMQEIERNDLDDDHIKVNNKIINNCRNNIDIILIILKKLQQLK